jgi:hypothetical protein
MGKIFDEFEIPEIEDYVDPVKEPLDNFELPDDSTIELHALDCAMEEELELLKEEVAKNKYPQYEYLCPYCDFKADFFHIVTIHLATILSCKEAHEHNPCYPILHKKEQPLFSFEHSILSLNFDLAEFIDSRIIIRRDHDITF